MQKEDAEILGCKNNRKRESTDTSIKGKNIGAFP